jgi:hypothetical protein
MPNELKKITALPDGTPADTDVVPFVDLATNTTKKALKSELKGDKGDAATVDAGTTTTLAAGQSATVTNVGTTSAAIFNFAIPQGIQGLTGANGACVESVAFVGNDMVFTLDDSSTVTLTNAKTDLKGDTGAKIVSGAFVGDDLVFTLDDNSTATITGAKTDLQGIQGIQGIQGVAGNGISDISLISTVGLVKTYRITYTDDTTFDYTVTDGANGTGTLSSVVAGTNISIDNTDVNNPVINNTQDISGKEDVSNKKTSLADNSDTFYPTQKAVKTAVDAKQDTLAFTPEDSANKETSALDTSTTKYPCNNVVKTAVDGKMANPMTTAGDTIYGGASGVPTRLGVGTAGQVLTVNSGATAPEWADASGGGTSLWTAITATRVGNTSCTVVGDQTAIFKKGMIIRWKESGVDKVAMVSIPSTVSTDTTITFIGDTMASIDSGTFKYSVILGAEPYIARFAYAGTVGAVATDVMNAYYAPEPMKVIGVDLQVGTVASTSGTTTLDLNKNGTTFMTTKATLAYNVASSPTPFTADTATALALGDKVTVDIDGVTSTTFPVDLYVQLYLFPTRFLTLE